jgi:menaquinone-dependent protoporphyrinogen oxidase
MSHILILYSTVDGQTRKICQRLQQVLQAQEQKVTVVPIGDAAGTELEAFDKIVIGASIRYGKHNPEVSNFIARNRAILESKPNAFFSVNLVARKPGRDQPETNPYLQRFLKRISWKPRRLAVFAGRLDYPRYSLLDRLVIRLIMRITGGPTDPATIVEYTDWQKVEAFGRSLAET